MKKTLVLLALVVLAACLMGFAFGRITPVPPLVPAAGAAGTVLSSAVPLAPAAQPVAVVVTGLVCIVFGVLALAPLLLRLTTDNQ